MIDLNETERWHRLSCPAGGSIRLWLIALAALVVAAFGFGPAVSSAPAKGGAEVTPKVIGGTVAPDGSWPSQAYVEIERSGDFYSCGGTLIDPYWVLTAAHCVVDEDGDGSVSAGSVVTAIGINDLRDIEPSDVIGIQSILIHPDYQALSSGDRWDFALLELALPSDQPTTPLIEPGQEAFTVGASPGKVAGWGCTSQSAGTCLAQPFLLQEADVSFISDALCGSGDSYGGSFDPEIMVCAGNFETGTPDTCYGDSGGPLIAFGPEGEEVLAGVTSFGNECALPDYPGVYARVIAARGWILTTIEENLRLEVTRSGTGSGTVTSSPAGISCGSDCSNDFSYGTEVTLTAKAASGSGFTGWSGACSGTGSCVLTIREASSVNANFKKGPTVSLKAKPPKRTHSRTAKFRFKASQSGSTFRCRLDGRNWQKCKSPKTYKNLKPGRNHTFRVKATKGGITGPVKKYTWNVKRH